MKKFICVLLCVLMALATLTLVACDKQGDTTDESTAAPEQEAALKFGMGVYTNVSSATDASEDVEGQGKVAITAAVITVDAHRVTAGEYGFHLTRYGSTHIAAIRRYRKSVAHGAGCEYRVSYTA